MNPLNFADLGLGPLALKAIEKKGFEEPTPIQALTIPRLLVPGPDLVARARTGTGKTAAFGLPLIERFSQPQAKVRALVLVPTRELALQVSGEIMSLRSGDAPRVAPVYGGASIGEQFRRLRQGVDIVVGTPGRVLDHLERGSLDLSSLEFLVLDEADEMLDMGFIEDIETVLSKTPPERRVILFSATMPQGILSVARRHFKNYEIVEDSSEAVVTELAEQVWLEVREQDRLEALCRIIDAEDEFYGIVFTSTRVEADRVAKALEERGYGAEPLHGEITQEGRERVLAKFREKRATILVATDVAARGIDIERLTHVVNWSLPHDPDSYVHRVGRTGRAGNAGTAVTFVTSDEYRKLFRFKRAAGAGFKKGKVPAIADVITAKRDRIAARVLARAASSAVLGEEEAAAGLAESEAAAPAPVVPAPALSPAAAKKVAAKAQSHRGDTEAAALWSGMAEELLARLSPKEALAAVLFEAFGNELDPARYREIQDVSVDAAATARLFIGAGRRDGVNPRSLATLLSRIAGIPDRLVGGIEVYEGFSFVTVPFQSAERVIAEARRSGGLPPVRLATPRGDEGQGPRSRPQGAWAGRKPAYRDGGSRPGYQGNRPAHREDGSRPVHKAGPGPKRDN
jgi:ATP-dependent RNA helicase DeaD